VTAHEKASSIQPSLFDQPQYKGVRLARRRERPKKFRAIPNIDQLQRETLALFRARAENGVWADHVYEIGLRMGVCAKADRTTQRANAWIGNFLLSLCSEDVIKVLRRPDASKVKVSSTREGSHRNEQCVYVLPQFYDRAVREFTRPRFER
jgi:hypothetical protein